MQQLRTGVIGAGSVVREIYQYLYAHSDYSSMLNVDAVAEPNEAQRNWFGEALRIPAGRRFESYQEMLESGDFDVVQVNTPDHMHAAPAVAALKAGADVLLPKPTAATVADAHEMIKVARETGRLLLVDYHKREDPRIKEAEARYQNGAYGRFQAAVWYMIDKLLVADPNHDPPFFATPDFAEKNTPVSFLTVHMCDALIKIVRLRPVQARAMGYSHKLPSLKPAAVQGYDLCDTELLFENGATGHIITGWHLPNTAHATTVQSSRIICSDGMIDMDLDKPGYHELHADGISEVNPLFKNFAADGTVRGYGMESPGRLYQRILAHRNQQLDARTVDELLGPFETGFYTTLVLEAAEKSLETGEMIAEGVTSGRHVNLDELLREQVGNREADAYMGRNRSRGKD